MTCALYALCIDARDPVGLARSWAGILGFESTPDRYGGAVVTPHDETGFRIRFVPNDAARIDSDRMHFDLTSTSLDDQARTVARALEHGARHIDVGQRPEEGHVVLADAEGNEFCVIGPGNKFLAGCPFIGAIASDGSQQVGYFWSRALEWPLVWDQDEETAIQSPSGGPKITWGGPPVAAKTVKSRWHFDLAAPPGGDRDVEVARLVGLGASRVDIGQREVEWVVLADPDGNEFCVLPPV